jgi:hypothetical protein
MTRLFVALAGSALLLGCAGGAPTARQAANQAALAEARPVGAPVDCVTLSQIDHTRVRDDRTIDFYMKGGRVYRNRLPQECPNLGFEEAFTYKTSLNQLCSVDIITVLQRGGGNMTGASCGLGSFQEIETSAR